MKITDLKVTGFKSFVEPVRLQIEPGLTGIVGPNGCGKSNVLESLRWVMGATSARALRGAGMDDVIFSGTDRRPARDLAEVSITIDNSAGKAPPPFSQAPALEVTRKIKRGAGSTFRINGKEVRARDVQLLFADASTGANSPALVRQGQVSELIGAKPENRRRILEEAAGISGLYARRHEAELRLRAVEANLEKLDQLLEHLGEQLKSLNRQAKQAARYRVLADEIRGLEAFLLGQRHRQATAACAEANAQLTQADLVVADTARAVLSANRDLEGSETGLGPAREEQAIAEAVLRRLEGRRIEFERTLEQARAESAAAAADLSRIDADAAREQRMIDDASATLAEIATLLAALPAPNPATEAQEIAQAQAAFEVAQSNRDAAVRALDEARAAKARREAEKLAAQSALRDAQSALARRQQSLAVARGELARLKAALPDASAITTAQEAANAAQAQSVAALEAADEGEAKAEALAVEEAAARDAARATQSKLDALKAEKAALDSILRKAPVTTHAPVLDEVQAEAGFERALAAALGDDLQASLDAKAGAAWLGATVQDIAWPIDCETLASKVRAPTALAARLAAVAVVDEALMGNLPSLPMGARVVTKAGDLARWDGFVRKAGVVAGAAIVLEQRNRRAALDTEIAPLEQETQTLGRTAAQARADLASAQAQARTLRNAAPAAMAKLAQAREALARLEMADAQARSRLESAQSACDGQQAEVEAAQMHAASREQALVGFGGDEGHSDQALIELISKADRARTAADEARNGLMDLQRASKQKAEQRARQLSEQQAWTRRSAESQARLTDLGRQRFNAEARATAAKAMPGQVEEKRQGLLAELPRAEARQRAATDALVAAETKLRTLRDAAQTAQNAAASAREARAAVLARQEALDLRLQDLEAEIARTLGYGPEELDRRVTAALGDRAAGWDSATAQAKLERALRDRESLGGVNLQADEEAAAFSTRIDGLTSDRADLTGAIAKLRGGVDEINAEGRERLIKAFDKVHGHFRVLFSTLFGGGTAELQLTESDDPLGGGLEVYACPPGKKLQSMTLMSGGEQALTAAALIFAVFLSNPAPVCVLDEVDAPLDDANVDRFCLMLEQMRKETDTRFIVITHHPITMARMDRLFGVTMAERGVSQVVSVDLQRAEALVGNG